MESRFIKTKGSLMLLALYAVVATSCSDIKKEVKTFATEFAQNVNAKKMDAVQAIYPDAAKIDSFALDFNPDSIVVTETETPNVFKVSFSSNKNMLVQRADDGKLTVKESHGLYAISPKEMDFALKTGWVKQDMPDVQIVTQLADTAFVSFLAQKAKEALKSNLVVKGWDCTWTWGLEALFVVIENKGDVDVSANDYAVKSMVDVRDNWGGIPPQRGHVSVADVKAHETKKMRINMAEYPDPESKSQINVRSTISIIISDEDAINKYLIPTGNEYKEYLESKK